ncbi:TPA: trypsin-like peptidase domain-containing protein [Escherichia coli]
MKKQTQLLSALALSVGLTLSASFQAVASIPGQVADQAPLPSLAPMLEKVLPAVVSVRVEGTASQGQKIPEEFKKFFGDDLPDQPAQPFEGLGSGVIINASKGYVLTNNHVINQAQKISIQLNDGREFDAKLIGSDDQSDIALLQIQNPSKLTQIAIADSDKLRVGEKDDVIIGVNRDRVNSIAEMRKVLAAKPAIIALQIVRGNESLYLLMR